MPADTTPVGFTDEQVAWLERWLKTSLEKRWPGAGRSFDRATIMWIIGGLTALGVAAFGVLWVEIRENRAAVVELAKGQARIEAILDERLPRPR